MFERIKDKYKKISQEAFESDIKYIRQHPVLTKFMIYIMLPLLLILVNVSALFVVNFDFFVGILIASVTGACSIFFDVRRKYRVAFDE